MATIPVVRYLRKKCISDPKSPMVHSLRQKTGDARTYTLAEIAGRIESFGSLSAEDVEHVAKSLTREIRKELTGGNKVKINGLGTFFTTLTCPGVETEKECNVRNIKSVNLRFRVDSALRLLNGSNIGTRTGENVMNFELVSEKSASKGCCKNDGGGNGGATDGDKPSTEDSKPSAEGSKPSTGNSKPSTDGSKPSTDGSKPSTGNSKPSTGSGSEETPYPIV